MEVHVNERDNKREVSYSRNNTLNSAALVGTLVYTEFYAWGSDKWKIDKIDKYG